MVFVQTFIINLLPKFELFHNFAMVNVLDYMINKL